MEERPNCKVKEIIDGLGDWFLDEERLNQGRMTDELYPYDKLFEPIQINKLKIKNRIVMAPMGNVSMADETGKPGQKMIKYFIERAKGGAGLITSGMTPVSWKADPSYGDLDSTGIFPRIDSHRTAYSGWRAIAEGCHAYGARFFIQLAPGMGRVGNPECLTKKYRLPISSSWNNNWYIPQIPCRPLTDRECRRIIRNTGQISVDAKELGIDGVYLHGHSGYLIEQMTDPAYNRRKLGRYRDWQSFGLDMVREIRRRCGAYYPIHYRIDLSLALRETYGEKMDEDKILKKFRNGRTADMTLDYMENLIKAGVDVFDVDLGGYDNWWLPHPPNGMPPGVYIEIARLVKEHFDKRGIVSNTGYPIPVIAVGKLGYPDLAERALREGKCDMIMLGRPLLADPYWPQKVYSGRVKEIIPCIGDHEGCLGQLAIGGHPHCTVNPRTAFEDVYQDDMRPAERKKKIAIVGAGPAGAILACTAARRGHEVALYDSGDKAGGMLLPGSRPKIKFEIANYIEYINNEIRRISKDYELKTFFGTNATCEMLKAGSFDAIVTCTGTKPSKPPIPGIDLPHVMMGVNFLNNPESAREAERVVVIGGSDVGCEAAYMLAYEMNKKVTIVEMTPYFMKKTCTSNRYFMIHHLEAAGVKLINCARLTKIDRGIVEVMRNTSSTVPDPYITWIPTLPDNIVNPFITELILPKIPASVGGGYPRAAKSSMDSANIQWGSNPPLNEVSFKKEIKAEEELMRLEADLVLICTGAISDDKLYQECIKDHIAPEIYNIGDSFTGGRVLEAVKAGYAIGTTI